MTITPAKHEDTLTLALDGRLDTVSAPELEEVLASSLTGITHLIFDLSRLEYLSSAGLRLLLSAQKKMNIAGDMTVRGANSAILEIFEITGFSDILTIEA